MRMYQRRVVSAASKTRMNGGQTMFKKSQDDVGSAASPSLRIGEQQPIRSKNVSVIGPTLVFKGELSADEDLVIEGTYLYAGHFPTKNPIVNA